MSLYFKYIFFIILALIANIQNVHARDFPYGTLASQEKNIIYYASYTQWNEDYAVTANHVKNVKGRVFECSSGCDLQFFKKKASQFEPVWRDAVKGEQLFFVGQNKNREEKVKVGYNMGNTVLDENSKRIIGRLARVTVEEGMSGGPVYGSDGCLVGMTFAIVKKAIDENGPNYYSLYIPYAMIKQQWDEFLTQNRH